jgi:hypothetical protein
MVSDSCFCHNIRFYFDHKIEDYLMKINGES